MLIKVKVRRGRRRRRRRRRRRMRPACIALGSPAACGADVGVRVGLSGPHGQGGTAGALQLPPPLAHVSGQRQLLTGGPHTPFLQVEIDIDPTDKVRACTRGHLHTLTLVARTDCPYQGACRGEGRHSPRAAAVRVRRALAAPFPPRLMLGYLGELGCVQLDLWRQADERRQERARVRH
jgi:hypothetical protein